MGLLVLIAIIGMTGCSRFRKARAVVIPEQRTIEYRNPESLPITPLPSYAKPRTVSNPLNGLAPLQLSLDEAIRIALKNSEVVRVLGGFTASSSGRTIYDPGIVNTTIDQARGRFDPNLSINNTFNQNETAQSIFTPGPPGAAIIESQADSYTLDSSLTDLNAVGGTSSVRVGVTYSDTEPIGPPLNPQANHFAELSYVQPLLQGGGAKANLAPILIANIDTERSFFQYKSSVQQLVRGVIEGYWSLVFARTDRWARQQQVEQAEFAYERELSRKARGLGDLGDVAQTRVALTNFRATLVAAKSNVLQRESALLNIMGLSPTEVGEVIPLTPPHKQRLEFNWDELIALAERYRPDLIELKLIIEADQQRILLAQNNAQPRLDAVALYRWDGLEGRAPSGAGVGSNGVTDWTLGVNFSVPLGLRQARANVRQQELIVQRDFANLDQGVHNALHLVALSVRTQDQLYEQYEAQLDARDAAQDNLRVQKAEFANGRTIFLNVLQAIVDWGNTVSAEAQSLTQYNTELANLEVQTGTILEVHGVRFMEERQKFAGPCSLCDERVFYPSAITPTENNPHYEVGNEPAEEAFDLDDPLDKNKSPKRKPLDLPEPILPMPFLEEEEGMESTQPLFPDHSPPVFPLPEETTRQETTPPLFVPQGIDRIELTSPPGGIKTEEDPNRGSK